MTVPLRSVTAKATTNNEDRNGHNPANTEGPHAPHGPSSSRFTAGTGRRVTAPARGGDQTAIRSTTKISVSPGWIAGVGLWLP